MTRPARPARPALLLLSGLLVAVGLAGAGGGPSAADTGDGVPGLPRLDAVSVTAGYSHTCVVTSAGTVRCWGDSDEGQLAQGSTADVGDQPGESSVTVDLGPGRTAVAVGAGDSHTCAILDTGTLRCWGDNDYGQLGQGNTNDVGDNPGETTVAVDLGSGRTAVAVTAGDDFTCAILDNGTVRCWGDNSYGQLAQGSTAAVGDNPGETTVPVDLGPSRTAVALTSGDDHACAILDTGALRCWGYNGYGGLGQGNTDDIGDQPGETTVPVNLGAGRTARAVAAGRYNTCAVLDNGALSCSGYNGDGELGQGGTNDIGDDPGETTVPVNLGPGRVAVAVSVGAYHVCALLDDATMRCWGDNPDGVLGQGGTDDIGDDPGETTVPVDLGAGRAVIAIAAGSYHSCAVTGDGAVRCWGYDADGQLGQGSTQSYADEPGEAVSSLNPVQLGGLTVGRDRDGDRVRDAVDQCPTAAGPAPSGCPAVAPPVPVLPPQARLVGRKVVLATVLARRKPTGSCPKKVSATVTTKAKAKGKGKGRGKAQKIRVSKKLRTTTVPTGCAVAGSVKLPATPVSGAGVKVVVKGTKLVTKKLLAVRT